MSICLNCGRETKNEKFCNNLCQNEFNYKEYIKRWKLNKEDGLKGKYGISKYIKRYLFEKHNNKCEICGWNAINEYTGNIPLEIHHIDGNYKNNNEDNLQLLCPNCHSLTSTYKSHNLKGRSDRKKYYKY